MDNEQIYWDKMYELYWNSNYEFQSLINSSNIEKCDKVLLLISLFKNKYNKSFILSSLLWKTDLWYFCSKANWLEILEGVYRPKDIRFIFEDYGAFCDLVFLYRYIGIDSLSLAMKCSLPNKEKTEILETSYKLLNEFIPSKYDEENFNDETYPDKSRYIKMQNKLVGEGCSVAKKDIKKIKADIMFFLEETKEMI